MGLGLQDKIKLIPIDLKNRPTWYKDKVYPANKVGWFTHNDKIKPKQLKMLHYFNSFHLIFLSRDFVLHEFELQLLLFDNFQGLILDTVRSGKWSNAAEMTEEEALAEQQRMFAEARARINGGVTIPAAVPKQQLDSETDANLTTS
ncbi:OLC1v1000297C1 [Oldenlandia corymbosa var. corymbosa]|uniref:OLC1v1000297C1 n=1 Tax=Oldenlandia corymbosa var. corymbosa TaxID=529605 RepID=A0AAV1D3G4_OLDCO|nr:OLC1v1000297C1 [Oldenlandia corymbosa var. corymbosa]